MRRSPNLKRQYASKRIRTPSPDHERYRPRRRSPSPLTPLNEFSFLDYKRDLEKVMLYSNESNTVVNSLSDFWIFLKKYEATLKKSGKPLLEPNCGKDIIDTNSERFSKFHCINFTSSMKFIDTVCESGSRKKLNRKIFDAFLEIVSIYLDFKNKEKFEKLKKLRQTQKELPVANYRHEIVSAVQNERVVIVAGDTGCGKSTQVPQYLHEAGFQNIACTQPRRIACVSLSKRVAYEMLTQFESKVGYQIRFEKSKTSDTKICFITEGLLLRQVRCLQKPYLAMMSLS